MKFAKELERDQIPEWRLKYVDYKVGKKKLKAINRALRNVNNQTPRIRRRGNSFLPSPLDTAPKYSFLNRGQGARDTSDLRAVAISNASLRSHPNGSRTSLAHEDSRAPEEQPLNGGGKEPFPGLTRYGSIIGSPPDANRGRMERAQAPPSLKLPGAALDPENLSPKAGPSASEHKKNKSVTLSPPADNAFEVGKTRSPQGQSASLPSRYKSVFSPKRVNSSPGSPVSEHPHPLLKRVYSLNHKTPPSSPGDVPLEAYRDLDIRQAEFFFFLDMELEKVESFYKLKEDEATERLNVLREQLHIMRDRRLYEVIAQQTSKLKAKEAKKTGTNGGLLHGHLSGSDDEDPQASPGRHSVNTSWLNPIDSALEAVKAGKYGRSTNAMTAYATPAALKPQDKNTSDDRRDYSRRPDLPDVPYQSAKRKLKVALQEFYRGLELLKSYALLNRTAFRKINKKYDKTLNARPSMRYMSEKVNNAWFVKSDVIDGHIRQVEDLYARYFEKGNHKVAVGKLRIKTARAGDFTENSFRNGVTLAAGFIFGIQGLVLAIELLNGENDKLHVDTSYLVQIYAGIFLMNFLFLLFCMVCRIWHESKINYVFVFEYDTRHHLDWRQLAELPCFFLFLLGLFMWVNFNQFGSDSLFLYYPVILLGISTIVLFFPAKVLYYRSRMWLIYSMWRLILAGLYPVEFRDFYLGDMFCSLTYAMGNIELFFCLYVHGWSDPIQCNSSHSRLLGFFATLPAIWRALQCLRRYADTRSAFPHLFNCLKYMATIMFNVTLSIYRIDKTPTNRAVFIVFAIANSLYCSFWDVVMDWSLGDSSAPHPFLRQMLGYKKVWMYYGAMFIDPILRFNWVVYAVDPLQLQHSAVTSFVVAFTECGRRGMWSIFRVENEHCTNVQRFRASRDVPLPYDTPSSPDTSPEDVANVNGSGKLSRRPGDEEAQTQRHDLKHAPTAPMADSISLHAQSSSMGADLDLARTRSSRRRRASSYSGTAANDSSPLTRGLTRVGTYLRNAHAQDFERKRKPELGRETSDMKDDYDDSSDEEDERMRGSSDDAQDEEELEEVRENLSKGAKRDEETDDV